ncbi:MAG: hypothetical protein U0X20_24495 [Caldilineaceae bacterium]
MDYYELELARREDELEDMREAERQENRFLLAIIAILAGGAGAALMLAGTALLAMLFVLSYPGITNPVQVSTAASVPAEVPAEVPTEVPTAVAVLPSVQAAPAANEAPATASASEFPSGGLGLSRAEWESMYGPPIGMVNGAARYAADGATTLDVIFLDDMVQSIDWQTTQPLSADAAMTSGKALLPADVSQTSSYAPPERPEAMVYLYSSEALALHLGSDPKWWRGGETGTLLLQVDLTPAGVNRLVVSTGSTINSSAGSNP